MTGEVLLTLTRMRQDQLVAEADRQRLAARARHPRPGDGADRRPTRRGPRWRRLAVPAEA